jgi:hypothetical protein
MVTVLDDVLDAGAEQAIMAALASVPDPEIPVVSVLDLGIVRGVRRSPPAVLITPTYDPVAAVDHRLDQRRRPHEAARLWHRPAIPARKRCRRLPTVRINRHARSQPLRIDPVQGAVALHGVP